jgi:hypothetical protein
MSSFVEFYAHGGFFNHLITVGFGLAVASLVFARRDDQKARWLDTCTRALVTCLGLGVLGTAFGIIEVGAAVATVAPELASKAAARGFGIAILPLAWSLLGAIPLWIVCATTRHRAAA